jgi:hypothetical protein
MTSEAVLHRPRLSRRLQPRFGKGDDAALVETGAGDDPFGSLQSAQHAVREALPKNFAMSSSPGHGWTAAARNDRGRLRVAVAGDRKGQ